MDIDYYYYITEYHGTASEDEFNAFAGKASAYLNAVTFGRLEGTALPEEAKLAFCAVIDAYAESHSGSVASESNDGISVTYVQGTGPAKTEAQRLREAVSIYLGHTGLLYRGV